MTAIRDGGEECIGVEVEKSIEIYWHRMCFSRLKKIGLVDTY
jgi:hypothetical protein